MGQAVEALAAERGHAVVARFDSTHPLTEADASALHGADVVIDFSLPGLAPAHIERYCRWNQAAVVGTTGWYDALDQVREWVAESEAAILYAPNFSLGVALLVRALRHRKGARAGIRVAGLTPWTRRNFARWLFEDYPRAVVATPSRWHRGVFTGPGTYADRT